MIVCDYCGDRINGTPATVGTHGSVVGPSGDEILPPSHLHNEPNLQCLVAWATEAKKIKKPR